MTGAPDLPSRVVVEVCLDSADSAVAAERGGADRVELCDNLIEGGTTPSAGMILATRRRVDIGLQVMIRPRGGDFCYSEAELEAMRHDIDVAKDLGADGVVFGILGRDGTIDRVATARLLDAARPMNVTFHRAFDMTRDPMEALDALIDLGVDRLLTSGQEATVADGVELVSALVERAGSSLEVMPGCGLTPRNAARIVAATGAREIHIVGAAVEASPMTFRNGRVFMGTELRSPEYRRTVTGEAAVRAFVDRIAPSAVGEGR
ncbi:MAG: copper homeostasis protein CutC [Acidobacteriota bacterium]